MLPGSPPGQSPRLPPSLSSLAAGAPDPAGASRRLDRLAQAASEAGLDLDSVGDDARAVLREVAHKAPYLVQLLIRDPERLARVAFDPYLRREKPTSVTTEELSARCRTAEEAGDLARELRRFRADELVRIGFRELHSGTPTEVGRELAALADASFNAAIEFHQRDLDARYGVPTGEDGKRVELVVIGMGKLGGRELNFSSDVDVIYAYGTDDGAAGQLSLHDYFARLARAITAALAEVTDEGIVFRVDLRLRPEGTRGTIVNSVPSLERYYESFGRPWERQAWIKARPCAGSPALGDEILSMLRPFVYPRSTSVAVIDEVRSLNERIKRELVPGGVESGFDVKNGVGGIREIEFFVQALQLVHGGQIPAIRSRNTLNALNQLLAAGLVSEGERRALADAYLYLRHAEHVLQLESGRQTQRLPTAPDDLEVFAQRLGHSGPDEMSRVLAEHTAHVAEAFATLGSGEDLGPAVLAELLSGELDDDEVRTALVGLGFRDPERAAAELERARNTPASPFAGSAPAAIKRVGRMMLYEVVSSAAPDQALTYVVELIRRRGSWALVWRLMVQEPGLARLVVSLFATSDYLSRLFITNPELADSLLGMGRQSPTASRDSLRALADATCPISDELGEDDWNRLAELKGAQTLRIGLADIGGELDSNQICTELSVLADVCLERALAFVETDVRRRHGTAKNERGEPAALSVLAMGKLGGEELGYASDLDVIFVYTEDGESDGERPLDNVVYMTRVAQRLMSGLHALHPGGRLYELDTRLRPSGRKGLLVSSWDAWRRYHQSEARLWERQALTKLRFVAGDATLGRRVEDEVAHFLYGSAKSSGERRDMAAEIAGMRERIENELGGQIHGYDIKTGRGGLIDIEFTAQYLQLAYGNEHPELRRRKTTVVLEQAAELGLADRDALAVLADGYRFLRGLEHRMRIVHDRAVHKLPTDAGELERLARRVGHQSPASLTSAYAHWTGQIRRAYSLVLDVA